MTDWQATAKADRLHGADKVTLRMPKHQFKYHKQWLKAACEIEDATETVILNPRNIQAKSLHEADLVWLRDKARYRQGLRFYKDSERRKANGK